MDKTLFFATDDSADPFKWPLKGATIPEAVADAIDKDLGLVKISDRHGGQVEIVRDPDIVQHMNQVQPAEVGEIGREIEDEAARWLIDHHPAFVTAVTFGGVAWVSERIREALHRRRRARYSPREWSEG